MPRLPFPITTPAALVLAVAVSCVLFPAAALAGGSGADTPGTFTLVESWPEHTQLDLSAIPDAPAVWAQVMGDAAARLDLAGFYFSRKGDGKDAGGPAGAPDLLLPVLAQVEAAAGRGVKVRLLADAKFAANYAEVPAWAGALPGAESRLFDVGKAWGGVLHAKYFLVDDDGLYLGSQNFDWRALGQIHELGVLVRDRTLAARARRIFDLDWALAGGQQAATATTPGGPAQAPLAGLPAVTLTSPDGAEVRAVLAASPQAGLPADVPWDLPLLVEMMDAARDSVHLQLLSYSVADREGRLFDDLDRALRRAAVRGAKVRIILADWAATKYAVPWLKSLAAVPGIELRLTSIPAHPEGFIPFARVEHAKYLTVDGNAMWLGTSNWSRDYFFESRNLGLFLTGAGAPRDADVFFNQSWHGPYATAVTPCGDYAAPRRN
jgi:phosphatidylserine/phosphatidylglycerophosphate/cardiolipin synthase-like enzyme